MEAIINSRPLYPLSSSPDDLSPLTPGHFLIGRALTSLPSPCLLFTNTSRLDRYRRLEQARQHFWKRWTSEYIAELQQRTKWRTKTKPLELNDLVLIKDDVAPHCVGALAEWRNSLLDPMVYLVLMTSPRRMEL